jgi:hypothetical protein
VLKEIQDQQDLLEPKELKGMLDQRVTRDYKGHKELRDQQVTQVPKEIQDQQGQLEIQEHKET